MKKQAKIERKSVKRQESEVDLSGIFGTGASDDLKKLLDQAGIQVVEDEEDK